MPKVRIEGNTAVWGPELIRYLRIDPFEFRPSRPFYLAGASLHALPTVISVLPLSLSLACHPDAKFTARVLVDGVEIYKTQNLRVGLAGLDVPLGAVSEGQHTQKVCAEDGLNQGCNTLAVPFVRTSDAAAVSTTDVENLFAWVEALAPGLLKPNGEASGEIAGFYARCYAQSGQCIAVEDNHTYYFDGKALTDFGSSSPLIAQAKAAGF